MTSILDKIRKTLEEGFDIFRDSAAGVIEKAEDIGKVSKLKFEIKQLSSNLEKKLTLLGDTVYPFLKDENYDALKDHEGLKAILEDIQGLQEEIDAKEKEMKKIISENEALQKSRVEQKIQSRIKELEKEIEEKMKEIEKLRQGQPSEKESNPEDVV